MSAQPVDQECSTCRGVVVWSAEHSRFVHADQGGPRHALTFGTVIGPEKARAISRIVKVVKDDDESDEPPLPEPLVRSRPALPHEIPGGAKQVMTLAKAAGFGVSATFARGPKLGSRGGMLDLGECVVVRATRVGGAGAAPDFLVASWGRAIKPTTNPDAVKWTFETAYVKGGNGAVTNKVLRRYIETGDAP